NQAVTNRLAVEWTGRRRVEIVRRAGRERRPPIHRLAEPIEYAAEQRGARENTSGFRTRRDRIARLQPPGVSERHQEDPAFTEPDDLRSNHAAPVDADFTEVADGGGGSIRRDKKSDEFTHASRPSRGFHAVKKSKVVVKRWGECQESLLR